MFNHTPDRKYQVERCLCFDSANQNVNQKDVIIFLSFCLTCFAFEMYNLSNVIQNVGLWISLITEWSRTTWNFYLLVYKLISWLYDKVDLKIVKRVSYSRAQLKVNIVKIIGDQLVIKIFKIWIRMTKLTKINSG